MARADDETLSVKGIIGSLVSKLGDKMQSRWFLYLGEALGKEEREAFSRWLAIEVRAAEIYRNHKMAAEWFGVSKNCPSEVAASCEDEYSCIEGDSVGHKEGSAAGRQQQPKVKREGRHSPLGDQSKNKKNISRKR